MSTYPVDDLVGYLTGRWRVARTLADHDSGVTGRFTGVLTCVPGAEGGIALTLSEDGELDWSGVRRRAFRTTHLRVADEPGVGEVLFEDGRLFHGLDLRSGTCAACHPCAPDTYDGVFTVRGPDDWSYEWRVTGPRKDLRLTTHLTRECPSSR